MLKPLSHKMRLNQVTACQTLEAEGLAGGVLLEQSQVFQHHHQPALKLRLAWPLSLHNRGFLKQYTRGQPRELVRSCQHMTHDREYAKAKALLQEHFGNAQRIASAYMEKALSWPPIKSEDVRALQAYSLFLRDCCNAMEEVEYMYELDMPSNLLTIIKKLAYKHRDRWRTVACELQERCGQRATFTDIVDFIQRQVKIASDPLFGDIQDTQSVAATKDVRKTRL